MFVLANKAFHLNRPSKMETSIKFKTIDDYFATVPDDVKPILAEIRNIIKQAAPTAKQVISYNMPAFKQNGILVYYAAQKSHIGFYPTASPILVFKDELSAYKFSKGAIQFPLDKPLPVELISKMVKFRVLQDLEKQAGKKK
jgi:uncharacterized protein YdhG (YjbR/CyaY superfamily)